MRRIYLDNAATSWPKPESVYAAVDHYQRQLGAPAGRGVYWQASQVERQIQQTRTLIAQLLGVDDPNHILFAYSGTDALMLALRGLLRPGDHVVTSVCDHNAVLRPLRYLEEQEQIQVNRVEADAEGIISLEQLARALRADTRLVALLHASNVTGALQPIRQAARLLEGRDTLLLVDAAQTVGHIPFQVADLGCDLLAAPGHKGLLGPLGTGLLYVAPGREHQLQPVRLGGTGTDSDNDRQPEGLPFRFEAGNLNVPGLIGLGEGVRYLLEHGVASIAQHEQQLTADLLEGLADIPGVTCYGPRSAHDRTGVVSLNLAGHDPQELAMLLDQLASVQVRAGFHCAPLMHRALKTTKRGGTVRLSCGPFNSRDEIQIVLDTLRQLATS